MKVLYATDMDRTIIYSKRFLDEYPTKTVYDVAETKEDRIISYISVPVKKRLYEMNNRKELEIVPVTTRSIEEFKRINIGLNSKYAIVSNGGTILEDGKPMQEWEKYIKDNLCTAQLMEAMLDLDDLDTVERKVKVIDNKYLFTKVSDEEEFDREVESIALKYPNLTFTRQRKKVYAIPNAFSKAVALRWLQNKIGAEKIVASGDSELDLPMLAIADYAVIPEHGDLIKHGYVIDGRIVEAGINSALYTMDIVAELINN